MLKRAPAGSYGRCAAGRLEEAGVAEEKECAWGRCHCVGRRPGWRRESPDGESGGAETRTLRGSGLCSSSSLFWYHDSGETGLEAGN